MADVFDDNLLAGHVLVVARELTKEFADHVTAGQLTKFDEIVIEEFAEMNPTGKMPFLFYIAAKAPVESTLFKTNVEELKIFLSSAYTSNPDLAFRWAEIFHDTFKRVVENGLAAADNQKIFGPVLQQLKKDYEVEAWPTGFGEPVPGLVH